MLHIDRTVSAEVPASPARCLERLADVGGYSSWSSLIKAVQVLEAPGRVRLRADVLGVSFEMDCELVMGDGRAVLRRLPNDPQDEERYEADWRVSQADAGAAVELHVAATLDAPGPVHLLRGRVGRRLADDLLADFTRGL